VKISALVVCGNEEANIADCLESVRWCDEIVVVDSLSSDRTPEIARRFTDRVIQRPWPGYVAQKQFALEQATCDWVLSLDADERCTPALRDAIRGALAGAEAAGVAGFEVRRHVFYLGRWIEHGGWYPDWKLRVARRERVRWSGTDPHDRMEVDGRVGRLEADLVHYTYRDFAHQLRTVDRFSEIVAEGWLKDGRRFSLLDALFHPPAKFLACYVWKRGFLDGWPGFVIAATSAFYVFAKQVKLREKQRAREGG
jgi:glycosyltransferase involved in cell wall biosynthesis